MDKRLFLATALSFLVLLAWSQFVSKTQLIENKEVASINIPPPRNTLDLPSPKINNTPVVLSDSRQPTPSLLNFAQEKFEIAFDESRGALKEAIFKEHQDYKFVLGSGFFIADNSLTFVKEDSPANEVRFVHVDESKKITKRFLFSNSNYTIELEILIQNLSPASISINFPLILGTLDFAGAKGQARYQDVTVATPEKTLHLNGQRDFVWTTFNFIGLRDRYFCAIIQPDTDKYSVFIRKLNAWQSEVGFILQEQAIAPGQQIGHKFRVYLGPQNLELINQANPEWSQIIHYGAFNFISRLLLQLLAFLYQRVHNWGWAIILLSLIVYILLYPLTLKQMHSMKEMNALKPHMEELRKLYKDNPQKLNKEVMELYRQHKVNPLGGCLPLILQIPIFFALYQALMRSVALKGAKFLWIKDLSEPDRLFLLPTSLPIVGNELNILPIIMAILMLMQQKFSMAATGGGSAEQEKIMMVVFPLMFGFIFYRMPAGLVLYWLINSTLMLSNQLKIAGKK